MKIARMKKINKPDECDGRRVIVACDTRHRRRRRRRRRTTTAVTVAAGCGGGSKACVGIMIHHHVEHKRTKYKDLRSDYNRVSSVVNS